MNIYPYVYRIDHPSGEFYIGSRTANRVPAEADFGHVYKTSSKYLSHPFEEYTRTILAEFYLPSGKTDAYDFEQALIFEHWGDQLLANKVCHHCNRTRFSTSGKKHSIEAKARMSSARTGKTQSDETKAKISAANRGKIQSDETKAKISVALAGKSRKPLSAETRRRMSEAALRRNLF